jgi:hypothetical protein
MQLKTDDRCRLTSTDLFKPNASYEAERTPDGSIRLVELAHEPTGKAKLVEQDGLLVMQIGRPFDQAELDRALEDYL